MNFLVGRRAQDVLQLRTSANFRPPGQLAGGVDRELAVRRPPAADGVVVLEREAERVHLLVAGGALGVGPVLLHPLAERGGVDGVLALVQLRGRSGGGGGGGVPRICCKIHLPALHRRGPVRVRGQRQDAGLGQHAAPAAVGQRRPCGTRRPRRPRSRSGGPAAR